MHEILKQIPKFRWQWLGQNTDFWGAEALEHRLKIWVSGCPSQVRQTPRRKLRHRQREATGRLGSSYATCQRILREDANMRRITAKFMSQLLAEGNPMNFAAVKTWMWSSILLTRIWPLVKTSVPVVLPAVANTLHPLHILGMGLLLRRQDCVAKR